MEYLIIASQPVTEALRRYVPPGAVVLAADAGWKQAQKLGLTPDLVLGDFDSSPLPDRGRLLRLPAEKNDTDTFYAVRYAAENGAEKVTILGGLGGRLDHTIANLQTLVFLAQRNIPNLMADETTEIYCLWPGHPLSLIPQKGRYLSVFATGGTATGVCLQGVRYPLQNAMLTPQYPLGVSNEFTEETAEISCETGYLLVMVTQKDG